jgi:type IV fimbrial biogenesis protein FimT
MRTTQGPLADGVTGPLLAAAARTKKVPPRYVCGLSCCMKRAFTLLELMLVLAVLGILLAVGVPAVSQLLDVIEVDAAAAHIAAAHQRARLLAITRSQVIRLVIDGSRIGVYPRTGTTPLWSEAGPNEARVTLAGPPRQFTFSPEGFTLGLSNASLQLTRGASRRTVVISRLGRVRVLR